MRVRDIRPRSTFCRSPPNTSHTSSPMRRTSLILAPAIVVRNWKSEFEKWLNRDTQRRLRPQILQSSDPKARVCVFFRPAMAARPRADFLLLLLLARLFLPRTF